MQAAVPASASPTRAAAAADVGASVVDLLDAVSSGGGGGGEAEGGGAANK